MHVLSWRRRPVTIIQKFPRPPIPGGDLSNAEIERQEEAHVEPTAGNHQRLMLASR